MSDRPALRGLYGPRQPLPVLVEPLSGESTGSFVNRLAHGQGLHLDELLTRVGFGQASRDPQRVRAYPQVTEMYVNPLGLRYLATLCGLSVQTLQEALPSLAQRHLLPEREEAVWKWPWTPREGHLVPLCSGCGLSRGVTETAWMISPGRWRMCARHLEWTDDHRSSEPATVSLAELPETVSAQQQWETLRQQFGAVGGQLFADAFQVAVYCWTCLPDADRWVQRAWSVELEAFSVRAAALVVLPEAAQLANRMLDFERLGERGRSAWEKWLAGVRHDMAAWGVDADVGIEPLRHWLSHHREQPAQLDPQNSHAGHAAGPVRLPGSHERHAQPVGDLGEFSCLPWQLGQPACEM
ncbi:TniQ family protein [Streptomyces demainii]|uniref:TniQ family protein n=1 Tax=Streptomyces demainii TaxID=588122 RepID=UPI0027D92546|nr:TniQ family protein [Streptomyces demainii]